MTTGRAGVGDLGALPAAAERADFRAFLVEPLRRARELLRERTGIDVDVRVRSAGAPPGTGPARLRT